MDEAKRVKVYLKALTPAAQHAISGLLLPINRFPYRVGRESRDQDRSSGTWTARPERRTNNTPPNNELYLPRDSLTIYVSREHFEIQREGDEFFLLDRHSSLGTFVEGRLIGGDRKGGRSPLHHGDVIIVGSHQSGFVFKFLVESNG